MNSKGKYYWLLLLIPAGFIGWFFLSKSSGRPLRTLAVYGPRHAVNPSDTSYHSIPDFEFTAQNGQKISQATFSNSIYVAEFFFTTCQSICPIMNNNLVKVYKTFRGRPGFMILSHTVDPETDSIAALKEYALQHGVTGSDWLFVTGSKKDLYRMARKAYLLDNGSGEGSDDDFVHTQNFALVDKEKHIRGFYDGTDSVEISRLINDINTLFDEYGYKARTAR